MKVIRLVTYDSDEQTALDQQLARSLNDGIKDLLKIKITIRTIFDGRTPEELTPEVDEIVMDVLADAIDEDEANNV